LAKAFERLLNDQIVHHVESNNLLSEFQSGFRRNHSTITALTKVTGDLSAVQAKRMVAFLLLLDFSKAFDCVHHGLLVHKLRSQYHFDSSAAAMIASFLKDRSMMVEIDGVRSSPRTLVAGVPQGSVLSPLLFSLFINDLTLILTCCNFHFYADDLQIYVSGDRGELDELANRANAILARVFDWSTKNGLLLNPKKSQAMVIVNQNLPTHLPSLYLDSEPVEWSNAVKDLGIMIDCRLDFSRHVTEVCSKVYAALHRLRLLKYLTPRHVKMKLCKSQILPFFYYGDVFCTNLRVCDARKLEVAFNSCTRYVFNLRRFDHLGPHRNTLLGIPFKSFFPLRLATFFFNIIRTGSPNYLASQLVRGSARTENFIAPSGSNRKAVLISGVRIWNGLPREVKNSRTVASFVGAASDWLCAT
jgi:hypothetical protein